MHIEKEQREIQPNVIKWQYLNDQNEHLELSIFHFFFNEHVNDSGARGTQSN